MASMDASSTISTLTTAPTGILPSTNAATDGGRGPERQDWDKFPWKRYPGYLIHETAKRTGWTWDHGYDIKHETTGKRRWVRWHCVDKEDPLPTDFTDNSTDNHSKHLVKAHNIYDLWKSHKAPECATVSVAQQLQLSANKPDEQAILNRLIKSFNPTHFQQLLVDWITYDDIPFRKVESGQVRSLISYTNPQVPSTGCLPSHPTVRKWLLDEFNRHKGIVTEALYGAPGLIHISFDGWSSRNRLSLLGLNVHFLSSGKVRQFLIGLPELEGRHTGANLAEEVVRVIAEWAGWRPSRHTVRRRTE